MAANPRAPFASRRLEPCRECGRFLPLRKDGRVPMHRPQPGRRTFAGKWCDGSGLKPKWRRALIGLNARIAGLSTDGGGECVAHVCLDIEGGPRVFIQGDDPAVKLRIVEEPRG